MCFQNTKMSHDYIGKAKAQFFLLTPKQLHMRMLALRTAPNVHETLHREGQCCGRVNSSTSCILRVSRKTEWTKTHQNMYRTLYFLQLLLCLPEKNVWISYQLHKIRCFRSLKKIHLRKAKHSPFLTQWYPAHLNTEKISRQNVLQLNLPFATSFCWPAWAKLGCTVCFYLGCRWKYIHKVRLVRSLVFWHHGGEIEGTPWHHDAFSIFKLGSCWSFPRE